MKPVRGLLPLWLMWVYGLLVVETGEEKIVSVMKGDPVTLRTCINKKQQDRMKWYFNGTRIAQISDDPSKTCTDVQCPDGVDGRFRDRLQLNHQTGSLTITNIRITDAGLYTLKIFSSSNNEVSFSVTVCDVSAAELMRTRSVKEGESVTLDAGVEMKQNDSVIWNLNDTCIAQIINTHDRCADVQCDADERFRDRLKLNHQTGSLTITDTRITDSGKYELEIISSSSRRRLRRSIVGSSSSTVKTFSVTVTPGVSSGVSSGVSPGVVAGIIVGVLVAAVLVVGVIFCCLSKSLRDAAGVHALYQRARRQDDQENK